MSDFVTRVQKDSVEYKVKDPEVLSSVEETKYNTQLALQYANNAGNAAALTQHLLGIEQVSLWVKDKEYLKSNLVRKSVVEFGVTRDHVYRAKVDIPVNTEWDESLWVDTSVWGEITNINAGVYQVETCRLQLVLDNAGVLKNETGVTTVNVTVNGEITQYQTNEVGIIEFQVQKGQTYIVSVEDKEYYFSPAPLTFSASLDSRPVRMVYRSHRSGWYIVWDNNGKDETPVNEWDTANNNKAIAVKYYSSLGSFAVLKNSPIGSGLQWCVQQYQFDESLLPNLDNAKAIRDFGSFNNTNNIIALADNPTDGYGVVNNWVMNVALQSYVPAAKWCRNQLITIDGSVYSGNLPAAGVLNVFTIPQNITDMHEALTLIGSSVLPNIRSGYWWSSSQGSATNAWRLDNGNLYNINKTSGGLVLPFFDL
jgi:hypothetical protein